MLARSPDGVEVLWLSRLEEVENVLGARVRPKGEEVVIRGVRVPPRQIVTKEGLGPSGGSWSNFYHLRRPDIWGGAHARRHAPTPSRLRP